MFKRANFLRSPVCNGTKLYLRSRVRQSIACLAIAGALAFATLAYASILLAADEIQQIKVGAEIIYVPKTWIGFDSVFAGAPSGAEIKIPQPGIVEVAQLTMRPNPRWQPFTLAGLPTFIIIGYSPAATPESANKSSEEYKQMLEHAESLTPDHYGFVRIATGFAKPGEPPTWERFLYKGYRNEYGEALIVNSSNLKGVHSTAGFRASRDMRVQYLFSSDQFSESSWFDLHKRVMAFVDYLQTPK